MKESLRCTPALTNGADSPLHEIVEAIRTIAETAADSGRTLDWTGITIERHEGQFGEGVDVIVPVVKEEPR